MDQRYLSLRRLLQPLYGQAEAAAMACWVMDEAFGISRTDIYADKGRKFSAEEELRYSNMCQRLAAGMPPQQAVGTTHFCHLQLHLTPDVLIPRPETEQLVDLAVEAAMALAAGSTRPLHLLDAGTGSGCIACALKHRLPATRVTAWDISPAALDVARNNARRLGLDIDFEQRDILREAALATARHGQPRGVASGIAHSDSRPYDVVVSNPPYVCHSEQAAMEAMVLDHEPHLALFVPDNDPLLFYRALARLATAGLLRSGGTMAVEINSAYAEATAHCMEREGLTDARILPDPFGRPRYVMARRP